jgi:2-polyprenyl-3-methyl-5-hydroxy-6-metoxy-1,4-benzoquinol methylase
MNSLLDKIFRFLRTKKVIKYIPKNSIVCDIGCGENPYFLKKISKFIKKGVGFDLKVTEYKNSIIEVKNLKILDQIPLEKESVDVVTLLAVIEHLEQPQEILNEAFRILKNDGVLILTTPTPLSKPILEFLAFKMKLIDKNEIKNHKNYFWPKEIKKMLGKAGFREKKIKNYFFEFFLNSLIIAKK